MHLSIPKEKPLVHQKQMPNNVAAFAIFDNEADYLNKIGGRLTIVVDSDELLDWNMLKSLESCEFAVTSNSDHSQLAYKQGDHS